MRIGDTAEEVRTALASMEGRRTGPGYYYLDRLPVISPIERATMSTECPRCNALHWLCLSGTGLPASSPHPERIVAAYRESEI